MKHIAHFLHDIYFSKRTGRLIFRRGEILKYFFFEEGNLFQVKTNRPEERLGEILVKLEKIPNGTLARIDEFIEPNRNIGEVLRGTGLISEEDLSAALGEQMRTVALNSFPIFDAEIVFQEREDFTAQKGAAKVNIPFLIEYGIRRMAYDPLLQTFLESKMPVVKNRIYAYLLTEEERAILERISGAATAESILSSMGSIPETFWKSLFLFYCLDVIDFKSEEAQGRAETEAAKEEEAEHEQPKRKETDEGPQRQVPDEDIKQRLDEVVALKSALVTRNYYQLLNVSRTASPEDIKRAYFNLARRYHPDSFGRVISKESLDQIGEVFNAVTMAYRTLINKEKRKGYDGGLSGGHVEELGDVAKRADTKFRQGKTLYAQERYEDAIIYLEEAVRMRKNKGDYYLLLAMAESKIPAFSKKAEGDFLKAVSLEPWNPEGYIGLGYLYKREGMIAKAAKNFQKALEVDADHKLAKQELRLIKEGQKRKGLAGLLSTDIFKKKK